jgi:plasmid stability protein
MGDFLIKDVPEPVKRAIESQARRDGRSVSATAITLLQKSLAETPREGDLSTSAWDELRPLLYDGSEEAAEEFAGIMEEVEASRKRDFGRPVPDPGT